MNPLPRLRASARLLLVLAPLTLAACANQSVTRTGFLDRYDTLTTAADGDKTLTYTAGSPAARSHRQVVIEEVEVRLPADQAAAIAPALLAQARTDYRAALTTAFARDYTVIDATSAGEPLRVRAAITGIKPSNPALNTATFLLVSPVSNGGVSTESEVIDARTGECLAAQATFTNAHLFNGGGLGGYFDRLGHIRTAFQTHAEKLRDLTLAEAGVPPNAR